MNIAVKKIELIEWLTRLQDEKLLQRVEALRKSSVNELYEHRMPKTSLELEAKLEQAERDIEEGRVFSQAEVESYFKSRFKK